jgi:hypothetical protein
VSLGLVARILRALSVLSGLINHTLLDDVLDELGLSLDLGEWGMAVVKGVDINLRVPLELREVQPGGRRQRHLRGVTALRELLVTVEMERHWG